MKVLENLSVVIVGITVVFMGLTILILTIKLTSLFFKKNNKSSKTTLVNNDNTIMSDELEDSDEYVFDSKIIAAITSAINMYLDKSDKKAFVVRHIKRINK